MSTEAVVRAAIVTAIEGIAQSSLGFDAVKGNVKDYLLLYAPEERKAAYLKAQVSGKQVPYAIGVEVKGREEWYAMRNVARRFYSITIEIYRALDAGVNEVIDKATVLRGAIHGMTSTLSETVDLAAGAGELEIDIVDSVDSAYGRLLVGTLRYEAEKVNPDF